MKPEDSSALLLLKCKFESLKFYAFFSLVTASVVLYAGLPWLIALPFIGVVAGIFIWKYAAFKRFYRKIGY